MSSAEEIFYDIEDEDELDRDELLNDDAGFEDWSDEDWDEIWDEELTEWDDPEE